jgi:hypothetical protein
LFQHAKNIIKHESLAGTAGATGAWTYPTWFLCLISKALTSDRQITSVTSDPNKNMQVTSDPSTRTKHRTGLFCGNVWWWSPTNFQNICFEWGK